VEGGYAGCIHKWGCCSSPFGYFFPDGKNKEMFLFTDRLVSITENNISTWFFNNYKFTETSNLPNFYDNAINPKGVGLVSGFNPYTKKFIFHIKRLDTESSTLSFYLPLNAWISFHSYNPSIIINIGAYTYSMSNDHRGSIYLHDHGDKFGVYYDENTVNPFIIEFQSNGDFQFTKTFDNIFTYAYFKDKDNQHDLSDFFSSVTYTDSVQSSVTIPLKLKPTGERSINKSNYFDYNVSLHNNEYRMSVVKVNRNYKDVVTSLNPRFKDRFLNCRLVYDNTKNNKAIIQYFTTKYRINFR